MKQFHRILVCVETLEKARSLLACASTVSKAVEAREVHLLHVHSSAATRPKMTVNGVATPAVVLVSVHELCLANQAEPQTTTHFTGRVRLSRTARERESGPAPAMAAKATFGEARPTAGVNPSPSKVKTPVERIDIVRKGRNERARASA